MANEIERKFLVNVAPDPTMAVRSTPFHQGYLALDGGVEVRLRDADGITTMTIKAGHGLSRTEVEVPLDADDAAQLWPHAETRSVRKVRHRLPLTDGLVAEVDVYAGRLGGLCTVEVEFADDVTAHAFRPPTWFGRELTGEPEWSNAVLARDGLPISFVRE